MRGRDARVKRTSGVRWKPLHGRAGRPMHAGRSAGPGRRRNGPAPGAIGLRSLYSALVDRRSTFGCLFEVVETLVLTLVIFFVIQNFIAQPYQVQQHSMERTLEPGQYVLVDKLTPALGHVQPRRRGRVQPARDLDHRSHAVHQARHRRCRATRSRSATTALSTSTASASTSRYMYQQRRRHPGAHDGVAGPGLDGSCPPASCSSWATIARSRPTRASSGRSARSDVIGRAFLRYWPISTLGILDTPTYPGVEPATP